MNTTQDYIQIIQSIIPKFKLELIELPLNDANVDSMDIVTLRVKFEKFIGEKIPNRAWLKFNSLSEIIQYCQSVKQLKIATN